ncbi:MAG: NAD-dependent epimerase/dehydratase family protein [Clostridia bacterium]|nr:NAD-dependent epimerase/dehydratase family protein [Clostridia bacterium]
MDQFIKQDCLEYLEKIDLRPLSNKTVFVTGANGLIGTYLIYMFHLANLTKNAGINIVAVSKNSPCEKLRDIFQKHYLFYVADLTDPNQCFFPQEADYIIHGATYAQPKKFLKHYSDTIYLNTTSTECLLRKAQQDGAKLLFLSSSEIYGDPDDAHIPTPEEYPGLCPSVGIRAIYAESKRMGETLCFAYRQFEAVDAKIARISMSYGPGIGLEDERLLANFIKQALLGKKIVMLDDGNKKRTFCYIADCVLMLLNILLYGKQLVYNVGGRDKVTIRRLAEEICRITGSTLSVAPSPQQADQDIMISPQLVELDIDKAQTEFHLPPLKPLAEGLARTIQWNIEQQPVDCSPRAQESE